MSALQLSPLLISTAQLIYWMILSKKEIVIATEALCPFEMLEDGKIVGLGKDISRK